MHSLVGRDLRTPADALLTRRAPSSCHSPSNPEEAVASQRPAGAQGPEDLPRASWEQLTDKAGVLADHPSVSLPVLHDDNEPDRSRMQRGERFALAQGGSVLELEIDEEAFDLGVDDLLRPEEHDVGRAIVVTCRHLEGRVPGGMGKLLEEGRDLELARVAQRRLARRIGAQRHFETEGAHDSTEGVQLNAPVAGSQALNG